MTISGKVLYDKVRKLVPDLSNSIIPEILNDVSNEPVVQPFLKWFCENVTRANVLSSEEIQLKNKLEKTNEWLEGEDLDIALEEATKGCPELLNIVSFDDADVDDLFAEYEMTKEAYKEDEEYCHTLKKGIQNLKKLSMTLEEQIEEEVRLLEKETIRTEKAYTDCSSIVKQYDNANREFSKDVERLLNVYADAAENKGNPILWTQMPLELFIKQIELYNNYLGVYVRREFGHTDKEKQEADSDYGSLINNSKEKRIDEQRQELMSCKANLANSKFEEIVAIIQEQACVAMLEYVQEIYNDGNLKVPGESELRTEILELTAKRDFLEENTTFLRERQLTEVVQQFAELEITKVLKRDAQARLERRKVRFDMLKNLRSLARERGHAHSDLLFIIMEMQFRRLKKVAEFVPDARHYLTTEYSFSSGRCESMQQQQNEYDTIVRFAPGPYNSFDKILISMLCGNDSQSNLNSALQKYNELVAQNRERKQMVLETYLNAKINKLETSECETNLHYINEIQSGPTYTLKAVSYGIGTCHEKAHDNVQKVLTDLTKIRNMLKERMRIDGGLEREKEILWQRFLADPETLRKKYEEAKQEANKSQFGNVYENK